MSTKGKTKGRMASGGISIQPMDVLHKLASKGNLLFELLTSFPNNPLLDVSLKVCLIICP